MTLTADDPKTTMLRTAERMLAAAIRKEEAGDPEACDVWLNKAVAKEAEANALS